MAIVVDIDFHLALIGVSVGEFAEAVEITPADIAVLEDVRAKTVRFTTLDTIRRTLGCQPGDVPRRVPHEETETESGRGRGRGRRRGRPRPLKPDAR